MCGICGYISNSAVTEKDLISMRDSIVYRGPDDAGVWQSTTENGLEIGLAHRRLSIMDLSPKGHQPMISDKGKVVVVYNGEIYNFSELRAELAKHGYVFHSDCDTEVLVNAYLEWDIDCFHHFNGMFAVAIWDTQNQRMILCRDRIGKKPLYYYADAKTGNLVFGSELKPIMRFPYFHKDIRRDVLESFFCNKYIASPNTIFKKTFKVEPGQLIIWENGTVSKKKYWDLLDISQKVRKCDLIKNETQAIAELDGLLNDSVAKRLVADVPVGVLLSGGIDSVLIAAVAQKQLAEKVNTFTIGFYDKKRNEAPYAKTISEYLGTNHTELYIGEAELKEMLQDMVVYYDEPFSDSSQLPTMLVSKMASEKVSVVLSGDGGDELFCGYKMYDWTYIAQKTDWIGNILYCGYPF